MIHVGKESDNQRARYLHRIQSEHVAMFEAIRARNPVAARKAARRHLSNALHRYQQAAADSARIDETAAPKPARDGLLAQPR
jgi:DNA-binding FadR family transcriptional regulator